MKVILIFLAGAAAGILGTVLALRDDLQRAGLIGTPAVAASRAAASAPASRTAAPAPEERPARPATRPAVRASRPSPMPSELPPSPIAAVPQGDWLAIPVAGVGREDIASNFDDARGNRRHGALDIMAPKGRPVLAAVDGTVKKLFTSRAGGLTIYQYDVAEAWIYYYAHLDRYAPGLQEGMRVRRGDVIGYVGTSGNATTPHLHFAVEKMPPGKEWWKGTAVDPYPLLAARGVSFD